MTENVLIELALIIGLGIIMSGLTTVLKQPLIIGYIATGLALGSNFLNIVQSTDMLSALSQLGIVVLLFMVGLSLSPKVFRSVGRISIITGLGQIIFTSIFGVLISLAFGFSIIASIYIAIALTFSSTIIIMKILSDKNDVDSLYGKISIGFLLVQDVVAMLILAAISSFSSVSGEKSLGILEISIILAIVAVLFPLATKVFPKLLKKVAKSREFLMLFSVGWCLLLAAIFHQLHFSMEIGALLAGVTLSLSPYRHEVAATLKPLRDFFIFLFFIHLGLQMNINNLSDNIWPIIIYSIFILVGNPIIVLIIMGVMGYSKKTSFLAGLTVAQISEFSLILIALGVRAGHLTSNIQSIVTMVGLITIAGSTYAMVYSDKIFPIFSKFLSIFERKSRPLKPDTKYGSGDIDVVLFGYDKVGYSLLKLFKKNRERYLIIDFNPEVIKHLISQNANCMYGDAEDAVLLDDLCASKPKMVVSTIPNLEINQLLLKRFRSSNDKTIVVLVSNSIEDSFELYDLGASYVIIPRFLGGEYASKMIEKNGYNFEKYLRTKMSHLDHLGDRSNIKHFSK